MTLTLSMKTTGVKEARAFIAGVGKQIPFITMKTINATAKVVVNQEKRTMNRVFDRPTRFTLNSLTIDPFAKKKRLAARVWFKDIDVIGTEHYIVPQVEGGARGPTPFERALRRAGILGGGQYVVPSRTAPLDRHGNVRRGLITKIMANIGAMADAYSNTPVQWTRERGRKKEFVFGSVGSTKGILQTDGDRWRLIFIVVNRAPRYRKRFPFYEVATKTTDENIEKEFDVAFDFAIRTAR